MQFRNMFHGRRTIFLFFLKLFYLFVQKITLQKNIYQQGKRLMAYCDCDFLSQQMGVVKDSRNVLFFHKWIVSQIAVAIA